MRNMARVTPLATTAAVLRGESAILAGFATTAILWCFGHHLPAPDDGSVGGGIAFAWIFAVMLWGTFAVVRHADGLAERLGEPFGTLILTISATAIEVTMIATVMLHGASNPTLARDTMFAVLMIVLNGMAGLTLLVGALRHREQHFNLQGAGAFLNLLVPLSVLSLVLPNYTTSSPGATLSSSQGLFLVAASVTLYGIFLTIQTVRHQGYFQHDHGIGLRITRPRAPAASTRPTAPAPGTRWESSPPSFPSFSSRRNWRPMSTTPSNILARRPRWAAY